MKLKVIEGLIPIVVMATGCNYNSNRNADSCQEDSKAIIDQYDEVNFNGKNFVNIIDTCMLQIYFPKYSRIDLVCGQMPPKENDSVIMVCAAAYTANYRDHFEHENIIGNHVSGGNLYKGATNVTQSSGKASYRGAFSFYDGEPHFAYDNWNTDFQHASSKGGCGFAQDMMIHDGGIVNHSRKNNDEDLYRALCLINGKLAIADSKENIPFGDFIINLLNAGATEAIYLDMGGWKHSWYRDESGKAIDIHPSPTKYGTNWITFYR